MDSICGGVQDGRENHDKAFGRVEGDRFGYVVLLFELE